MSLFNILNIASSAMEAQSKKLDIISTNLANSESTIIKNGKSFPYIAKKVILKFKKEDKSNNIGGVEVDKIVESKDSIKMMYDPNNPLCDKNGYIKTSNVNVISEMVDSISASRNYQANVEIANTIKLLLNKTMTIGQF